MKNLIVRLVVLSFVWPALALATDAWPRFRGPESAASIALPESFGLAVEWKAPLGSGYSCFVAADGRAVTMFTSSEDDVLAAFDMASGRELWRLRLAEKHAGHTGSDDGPISTPILDGDRVYALGPRGQLVAAALADGHELWRVELDEARASVPFYGYATVPLVAGKAVVVLTGGPGHSVTAFDRETGAVLWSRYDDEAAYQSPALAELAGRRQLLAVTDQWARGLDPETGDELWSFRHTEGETTNESSYPTPAGDDRVLIDLDEASLMLKVTATQDGRFEASELWRSRAFANTLALPVYREGTLYGFTGSVLVAADAASGDILWRTRAISGQNVSLVGEDLVMLADDGAVVVAAASRDGYREVARVAALDRGALTNPAIAGGRVLVRNLTEMASVRIDSSLRAETAAVVAEPPKGEFGRFVAGLAKVPAAERQARLDAFLAGKSLPLVEAGGIAHLIYRGDAEDVGAVGSLSTDHADVGLARIDGTDTFFASLELDPASHYEYAFVVDFGQPMPDPANPNRVEDFAVTSELRMSDWRVNPALADPPDGTPRGQIDRFQFHSDLLDNTREIQVWLPPDYRAGDRTYPLVVFNYGDRELRGGKLANVLDNLTAAGKIDPPIAVFVPRAGGAEFAGDKVEPYIGFLAGELVPHLAKHYRVTGDAEQRSILGVGSAGFVAVYATVLRPEVFGKAAAQAFYLPGALHDQAAKAIAESAAKPSLVWLEQSPNDYAQPPNDSTVDSPWLVETLRAKGVDVHVEKLHSRPEWGSWRNQKDLILEALVPAAGSAAP